MNIKEWTGIKANDSLLLKKCRKLLPE